MVKKIIFTISIALLCSCTAKNSDVEKIIQNERIKGEIIELNYATNFKIEYKDSHKIVEVIEPYPNASESIKYRLIPKSEKSQSDVDNYTELVIYTPIETIVCTSTTHLAPLNMLNSEDKLIGFPSTQYISSENIRKQVEQGKTIELGKDSDINVELLMEISPELVMTYTMTGDYNKLAPIAEIGIPIVMNGEYLENTPLGRAEWIKFMALFFNKEQEADSIFKSIESNYLQIQSAAARSTIAPTLMSGIVYGDTWFVPGGQSWAAKFFRDAKGNYLWDNDSTSGSIQLSFEAVYEKAQNTTFWIGAANYYSLDELNNVDHRYANFSAFKSGSVYTYNARAISNGGNDYFESGFSRPDIVLGDLVKILHPDLLPLHELYYFRKLDSK